MKLSIPKSMPSPALGFLVMLNKGCELGRGLPFERSMLKLGEMEGSEREEMRIVFTRGRTIVVGVATVSRPGSLSVLSLLSRLDVVAVVDDVRLRRCEEARWMLIFGTSRFPISTSLSSSSLIACCSASTSPSETDSN
jgi:hypothetical protein